MGVSVTVTQALRRALTGVVAAGALAVSVAGLMSSGLAPVARAAAADSTPLAVDITNPQATGETAQGPVGANVYVQGTAPASSTVHIGYATVSDGCDTGMQPISGTRVTANSDGTFAEAFEWPNDAGTLYGQYYVCASDQSGSTSIAQSTVKFQVVATSAPAITVQAVDDPNAATPGPGTPTPEPTATPRDGRYYAGGYVSVTGVNFVPGGQSISVFLTPNTFRATDYVPANALPIVSGYARTATDGSFTVVTQLPAGETGTLKLSVVSQDGTSTMLPTLVADRSLAIVTPPAAPTVVPTATTTPVTPTPQAQTPTNTTPKGPGAMQIAGLIGLGMLSVVFFIIGVFTLISASGMPREQA